jgi:hypothetical protein
LPHFFSSEKSIHIDNLLIKTQKMILTQAEIDMDAPQVHWFKDVWRVS